MARRILGGGRVSEPGRRTVIPQPPAQPPGSHGVGPHGAGPPGQTHNIPGAVSVTAITSIPTAILDAFISVATGGGRVPPPSGTDKLILLFSTTLAAPALSIDTGANGIPSGQTHLLIVYNGRSDRAGAINDVLNCRFNGDNGANYTFQENQDGSINSSTNFVPGWNAGATAVANSAATAVIWVPFYTSTTFQKNYHALGAMMPDNASGGKAFVGGGTWRNTAAINQFAVTNSTGSNHITGSSLQIYGF